MEFTKILLASFKSGRKISKLAEITFSPWQGTIDKMLKLSLKNLLTVFLGVAFVFSIFAFAIRDFQRQSEIVLLKKKIELLKEAMPPEVTDRWLTQVSEGPGMIVRGSVPEGRWRLASYICNRTEPSGSKLKVPETLQPEVALELPDPKNVDIEISWVDLQKSIIVDNRSVN